MDKKESSFFARKVLKPLKMMLTAGVSPHQLALAIAAGACISIFPIFGTTTFLCILIASVFKLNQVAIQVGNYLFYPVQLVLLIPLMQLGAYWFNGEPVNFTFEEFSERFSHGWWDAIQELWGILWRAVLAWGVIIPLLFGTVYYSSKKLLQMINVNHSMTDVNDK